MQTFATQRIVAVSSVAYDGYPADRMLDSLARLGATHVEPSMVPVYAISADEREFGERQAATLARDIAAAGLACHTVSAHMDLGRADAVKVFGRRMRFAARLGAKLVNTHAADRPVEARFLRNLERLLPLAEELGLVICFENPGHGSDNLFNRAADGIALLARIGSPRVALNHDLGNLLSHRPGTDAAADAIAALPHCAQVHLKDVRARADGWFLTALGDGDAGCARVMPALAARPAVCVSIELPMRLHRGPDGLPSRTPFRVPLADIESRLAAALAYVHHHLSAKARAA
ncbi:sugar phosphate isomerase/epimerase family protein [Derxia lacustris]|uniref:sugar phosphate isomerase/epimerase family protein n=1 Tax=Derxia lacustris TaxID=764842 RepID=UPI000A172F2B|nr:TIM barrel protein [Derxia lacustris]